MKLSSPADRLFRGILTDRPWLEWYIKENQKRLGESYNKVTEWCINMGIPYEKASAGFFILVDLRKWLPSHNKIGQKLSTQIEQLNELNKRMLDNKVLANPATAYHHPVVGYYRLTHSLYPEIQQLGLDRLEKTLKEIV